ncbi:MAG: hypothetical protein ACRDTG_15215 [Pseudonocardiaceae bacterium]
MSATQLPPGGAATDLDQLDRVPQGVEAQPGGSAWARLLFVLVEGRDGQ